MTAVVLRADARALPLPDASVDLIVTSPPYFGQRDYRDGGQSLAGQIGAEATPQEYIASLIDCTREWMRVLKPSGSLFVNLGDKFSQYEGERKGHGRSLAGTDRPSRGEPLSMPVSAPSLYGIPPKSLMMLPARYAIACTDQLGLINRRDIIWSKTSGMPESVTDRCATRHEYLYHFTRQPRYFAAVDEIREPHQAQSIARTQRNRFAPDLSQHGIGSPNTQNPQQACNPLGKMPGSVWDITSVPLVIPPHVAHAHCCGGGDPACQDGLAHHAAFPFALPRKIILGWSPSGICTECGEGRRPVVSRPGLLGGDNNPDSRNGTRKRSTMDGGSREWAQRIARPDTITGYACACPSPDAPVRPAVVLDPFAGTGTTMLVASALGRIGIGVDRSMDYCRIAQWRTTDPGEKARAMQVPKPPVVSDSQLALFA